MTGLKVEVVHPIELLDAAYEGGGDAAQQGISG
jgi:hypothetical protein